MGGVERAKMVSESLGLSSFTKKFIRFLLEKCGNCPFRIVCWSQLFEDKGALIDEYRQVFRCDGNYRGKAKQSFDGRQVVKFIKTCEPCKYLVHCMTHILDSDEFMGMVEATSDDVRLHVAVIKQCAQCPDNERCWSEILKRLGFGWASSPKVVGIMMKCKFKKEVVKP